MDGIEAAAEALVDRIEEKINLVVAELRIRYDQDDLPDVNSVTAFDVNRIAIEEWPAIMVVPQEEPEMRFQHTDGVDERWSVRYRHQVFVWVRGDEEGETALNRYRITLALRETLMRSRKFGPYDLDPRTFRTSYSDVMRDKDNQTIAGAYIELQMSGEELLHTGDALGSAETATVDTGFIPPHPANS